MAKLFGKRRGRGRLTAGERATERATVGLAVLAVGALGSLMAGEALRLARRRRESKQAETPQNLVEEAGYATRDTLTVARQGIIATPHHETVLFNMLQGFLGAFAFARLATWGIRRSWWPTGNIHVGGRHVHHFVPGILLAFISGAGALATRDEKVEAFLAVPFGAGVGLTLDEAALLLDLEDVYWTRKGLLSVQVSLAVTATLAATILTLRVIRRGEERGAEEGLIPATEEQGLASTGALA